VVLLAGIIMSARLQLNVHTPREVMIGSVAGLATGIGGMFLLFQY
jgi:membrane-associated phospholipid phosphatase